MSRNISTLKNWPFSHKKTDKSSEMDKSTNAKTGRTQVWTNKTSEFVCPFGCLVRRLFEDDFVVLTDNSSKTDLNSH